MAGQRSTRRGKAHREAFPVLDILEAGRSDREGGGVCQWYDERGRIVGRGEMLTLNDRQTVFRYEFIGSANIERSNDTLTVDVSVKRHNPLHVRRSFNCATCPAGVQKLFYVARSWACGSCHNLVFLTQRLGSVNKIILGRDEMTAELMRLPDTQRNTRWFYNRQRHIERLNRELVAAGCSSLPQELLYRTYAEWGTEVEMAEYSRDLLEHDELADQGRGLAIFQPTAVDPQPTVQSEPVGLKVLHRPTEAFFRHHKVMHFAALEHDIVKGIVKLATSSAGEIADLLAERLILRPLVLTGGWSKVSEVINREGRTECTISATYAGDPTLWLIGPGTRTTSSPLHVILDDEVVSLRVRVPVPGKADPQAELRQAAVTLEARLAQVRLKFDSFNAARHAAAARRVRYELLRKRTNDQARLRYGR